MHLSDRMKNAAEVRKEERLPADGRNALPQISRLEAIFRDVMAPDVPSYDVDSGRHVSDTQDWTYTEGFGSFIAFSQCVEVCLRIALAAAHWDGGAERTIERGKAVSIAHALGDKWEGKAAPDCIAGGKSVWFPPGANMEFMVNHDNVRRAFETDGTWMCKPHPVTADDYVEKAFVRTFGPMRVYARQVSGLDLLRQADVVGYTTASEIGMLAMLLGKDVVDFTRYSHEAWGRYFALYRAIRESNLSPAGVMDRLLSCPWSGYVPLDTPDAEAEKRFIAYRERSIEIHERCRPLTDLPPREA